MFTNTKPATTVANSSIVADFVKNTDPAQCSAILDELFFEWIGSEGSDDTDKNYRAKVAHNYRQLKDLLAGIRSVQTEEVAND